MKLLFTLLAALLWSGSAQTASFDCAKAQSRMERAICSNVQLSKLDETLTSTYQSAKGQLSSGAAKIFTGGHVSWLRFTASYCFMNYNAAAATRTQASQCLLDAYTQRIAELESTGRPIANFKTYIVIDDAIKVTPSEQAVYTVQRSYIQLDSDAPMVKISTRTSHLKKKSVLKIHAAPSPIQSVLSIRQQTGYIKKHRRTT